jgi:hypothetical protein
VAQVDAWHSRDGAYRHSSEENSTRSTSLGHLATATRVEDGM